MAVAWQAVVNKLSVVRQEMMAVLGEMAPHPYHHLDTATSSTDRLDTAGDILEKGEEEADCLNNNQVRHRSKVTNIVSNICVTSLADHDQVSCSADSKLSPLLPPECRYLLLSHQFLTFRSQRRVAEAARYLHPSCTFSLLPHYNSHLVVKNITSVKAFLSPSPPQVLCEFSCGDCSYAERIYFQVQNHEDWSRSRVLVMLQGDLIVGLVPEGCIPDGLISVPKQGYMTGLIMLGYALHAAAADSISDILYFTDTLAGQVVGHGCRGREEVTNLKMEYFRPCTEKGLLTYRYLDFFCVDLENSCVQFGFSCLIPGSEGRGTEFLHFDEVSYSRHVRHLLPDIQDGKISNILHVRHALTQQAWVTHQIQYIPQNSVSSFYYEFLARPAGHGAVEDNGSAATAALVPAEYHAGWALIVLVWLLFTGSVTILLFSIHYDSNMWILRQLADLW